MFQRSVSNRTSSRFHAHAWAVVLPFLFSLTATAEVSLNPDSVESHFDEGTAWAALLRSVRVKSPGKGRTFDILEEAQKVLRKHKDEAIDHSRGYGEMFTEFSRLLHTLNARDILRETGLDSSLRMEVEAGMMDISRLSDEHTYAQSYILWGKVGAEKSIPTFLREGPIFEVPAYLSTLHPLDRPKSLQNLWPGLEDISRYQKKSSVRQKQISQLRKDFVTHVTIESLVETMKRLFAIQAKIAPQFLNEFQNEFQNEFSLKEWGEEWLKGNYPALFHKDRSRIVNRSLWALRDRMGLGKISWNAYTRMACRALEKEGYPFQIRPVATTYTSHIWGGVTPDAAERKIEEGRYEDLRNRSRAIEAVKRKLPFGLGVLMVTEAIMSQHSDEALSIRFNCLNPDDLKNREMLRAAVPEAIEKLGYFWGSIRKDFDPDLLSEKGIEAGLRAFLEKNPAAVGRVLMSHSNQSAWVSGVGSKWMAEKRAAENDERLFLIGITAGTLLVPAIAPVVAPELAILLNITSKFIVNTTRSAAVAASISKAVGEGVWSQEMSDRADEFLLYYLSTGDEASFLRSERELERSREIGRAHV